MSVLEVLNKDPLTLSQMSEALSTLEKRDGELNFRAKKVKEYIDQIKPLSAKDAKALVKKLNDLDIPRMKPEHMAKLVDVQPEDMDSLKMLFSAEHITIKQEDLDKILAALKE